MLLLKVTKVTTGHQKLPKMGQNSIISYFFARKASAEGRSPPQQLEVSRRSGLYLLVYSNNLYLQAIQTLIKKQFSSHLLLPSM